MADLIRVEQRQRLGKRNNVRLRRSGRLPAVLYGHGEEAVSLTLAADQLEASLRHGAKVVDLDGDASGKALLQDVQWDTFFQEVLHVDLLRVRAGEKVKIDVPIELRGEAPGVLVVDKREPGGYVTPVECVGDYATFVSRIRDDQTVDNGLSLWVVSDNLRKGAALNTVQIAEVIINRNLLDRAA